MYEDGGDFQGRFWQKKANIGFSVTIPNGNRYTFFSLHSSNGPFPGFSKKFVYLFALIKPPNIAPFNPSAPFMLNIPIVIRVASGNRLLPNQVAYQAAFRAENPPERSEKKSEPIKNYQCRNIFRQTWKKSKI